MQRESVRNILFVRIDINLISWGYLGFYKGVENWIDCMGRKK